VSSGVDSHALLLMLLAGRALGKAKVLPALCMLCWLYVVRDQLRTHGLPLPLGVTAPGAIAAASVLQRQLRVSCTIPAALLLLLLPLVLWLVMLLMPAGCF
jgi:hypothetical protein